MNVVIPIQSITEKIFDIRGNKVMIDFDLAKLYRVPTKRLNEAVKRNAKRFPDDLTFQLSRDEKDELVATCDRFANLKHSSALPHAFTEIGVAMLSSVLNSETAIQINLQIIRAFIRLRQMLNDHDTLRFAIEGLERRVDINDRNIQLALNLLQQVLFPPERQIPEKKLKIGFGPTRKKD